MFLPAAAVAFVALTAAQTKPPKPFVLKNGDRVVWIGNTLAEREQRYGYWETALHAADPKVEFTVRNLGWSGDTVWGEARAAFDPPAKGYERLISLTKELKPTVILVSYGMNESFAGEAGVEAFKKQYAKLLDDLKPTGARFVLLTPTPFEKQSLATGDAAKSNAMLGRYVSAIRGVGKINNLQVVDLFQSVRADLEPRPRFSAPLSDNGMHLDGSGYHMTTPHLLSDLGLKVSEVSYWHLGLDPLRQAIVEKNQLFFYRWRPQNETYLFGFRKHEQGKNAKEIVEFDPLVDAAEKKIADLKAKLVK